VRSRPYRGGSKEIAQSNPHHIVVERLWRNRLDIRRGNARGHITGSDHRITKVLGSPLVIVVLVVVGSLFVDEIIELLLNDDGDVDVIFDNDKRGHLGGSVGDGLGCDSVHINDEKCIKKGRENKLTKPI
jgi:hypothetical protein